MIDPLRRLSQATGLEWTALTYDSDVITAEVSRGAWLLSCLVQRIESPWAGDSLWSADATSAGHTHTATHELDPVKALHGALLELRGASGAPLELIDEVLEAMVT